MVSIQQAFVFVLQVTLNLESKASHTRKQPGADYKRQKGGHTFSASNPYGKKGAGDQQQFLKA